MKKILILALILVGAFRSLYGQSTSSELDKIVKSYKNAASFSVKLNMRLYEGYESKAIAEEYKGEIKQSTNLYYSDLEEVTVLKNSKVSLVIDHTEKVMIVSPPGKSKGDNNWTYELDSAVKAYKSMKLETLDATTNRLILEPVEGKYQTIEIEYNKASHLISKMTLFVSDESNPDESGSRIEISYSQVSTKPLRKEEFSEAKFITYAKGKYVPAASYSTYRIVHYTK